MHTSSNNSGRFTIIYGTVQLQLVTKLEPNKRVEQKAIEAGIDDNKQWRGTQVIWDITKDDGNTNLSVLHKDWKEETELYKKCTDGWAYYVGESLKEYLETGKGKPFTPK